MAVSFCEKHVSFWILGTLVLGHLVTLKNYLNIFSVHGTKNHLHPVVRFKSSQHDLMTDGQEHDAQECKCRGNRVEIGIENLTTTSIIF